MRLSRNYLCRHHRQTLGTQALRRPQECVIPVAHRGHLRNFQKLAHFALSTAASLRAYSCAIFFTCRTTCPITTPVNPMLSSVTSCVVGVTACSASNHFLSTRPTSDS